MTKTQLIYASTRPARIAGNAYKIASHDYRRGKCIRAMAQDYLPMPDDMRPKQNPNPLSDLVAGWAHRRRCVRWHLAERARLIAKLSRLATEQPQTRVDLRVHNDLVRGSTAALAGTRDALRHALRPIYSVRHAGYAQVTP